MLHYCGKSRGSITGLRHSDGLVGLRHEPGGLETRDNAQQHTRGSSHLGHTATHTLGRTSCLLSTSNFCVSGLAAGQLQQIGLVVRLLGTFGSVGYAVLGRWKMSYTF